MNLNILRPIYVVLYIILAPLIGGILAGFDRKITARMQGRQGPPLLQPFYDVSKLFKKENRVVNRSENLFIIMFFIFMVMTGAIFYSGSDVLLVIFALTLASVFLVQAAYSTNSPYSTIGAERELIQMMSYEPAVLLVGVAFYMIYGSFNVRDFIFSDSPAILKMPGVFLGFLFVITIKLRKSPFDLSTSHHAHQELVRGMTTEFTGYTLALVEIAHWYENMIIYGLVFMFFSWKSIWGFLIGIAACLLVFVFEILIDNATARVKWKPMLFTSWFFAGGLSFINILIYSFIGR